MINIPAITKAIHKNCETLRISPKITNDRIKATIDSIPIIGDMILTFPTATALYHRIAARNVKIPLAKTSTADPSDEGNDGG